MLDRIKNLTNGSESNGSSRDTSRASLASLRAVTAQLLLATAAGTTLEQVTRIQAGREGGFRVPRSLAWAPILVAPLAAAANFEQARKPSEKTATALNFLAVASIGFGASLFVLDTIAHRDRPPTRLGSLAFASAGLLGLLVNQQERRIVETERSLRRRAKIVERLVPRRKARFDRIVVHV